MVNGNKTRRSYRYWKSSNEVPVLLKSYMDRVSGYTIRQIEDALVGQKSWNNWKNNIKNRYNNETKDNLDAAFSYWNTK